MNTHKLTHHWQNLSEPVVRQLQAAKLRHYLRTVVVPFSPHYRELFREHRLNADSIRSLEHLQLIPFTTKNDLVNTPDCPRRSLDYVLVPDAKILARRPSTILRALLWGRATVREGFEEEYRPVFLTSTTGRSADPIPFLYSRHDLANLSLAADRIMQVCGAEREFRMINMFPYAPHLAFWITHYASTSFGAFSVGSGGGKVMGTDGNLRLMKKLNPHVLIGMPTFLYHVMQEAVESGIRCENLQRLVLGGEKVADGMRRKLRQLARKLGSSEVDVLAVYGFTEAKMAWAECPHPAGQASPGYHLSPDLGVMEVIDPATGASLPPGHPGELVFTPLDARGTVVLRYRTGDFIDGGLFHEACPCCGRIVPRLVGKISRGSEIKSMQLDKIKGTLVDFNQLEHVLDDAPHVNSWQLELRKANNDPLDLDELIVHLHKSGDASDEKVVRELTNRIAERIEIRPNRFQFHDAEELRRRLGIGILLKEQKIIDNRPGWAPGAPVAGMSPVTPTETVPLADSRPVETTSTTTETANTMETTE